MTPLSNVYDMPTPTYSPPLYASYSEFLLCLKQTPRRIAFKKKDIAEEPANALSVIFLGIPAWKSER